MKRNEMLQRARGRAEAWDLIVIGGGATGAGIAVDAATRGYATLLLEQHDFGKGTSSRSTKLVHGGVRYLEQGNIPLVMQALEERGFLRKNAPHLVSELAFIVPSYSWWEGHLYGLGLKAYQMLSGKHGFGPSHLLTKEETMRHLPNINTEGLTGGVIYYDGQFDDARLLINLVATADENGATLLNYAKATGLLKGPEGKVNGVSWVDEESGTAFNSTSKVVINATGPFSDNVRQLAEIESKQMISPSQGSHLVFARSFLSGDAAIMVPHTRDGRVMFAIPWHGHTLVGTTDTPVATVALEPVPLEQEIDFMLETAGLYLARKPTRKDILSMFAGIRPLVRSEKGKNTAALSRDHTIHLDPSGLMSISGGKWTTYRHMAEDCVNRAMALGNLPEKSCVTRDLNIHGFHPRPEHIGTFSVYGTDAMAIQQIIRENSALAQLLDADLPYCRAEVVWAARSEMARTVEDVLARRTRALFLNARSAIRMAPQVAELLAKELGYAATWQSDQVQKFNEVAAKYLAA